MPPQPSRALPLALKATKAGIWLQKPGGRGQTPALVTTRELCTAGSTPAPCRSLLCLLKALLGWTGRRKCSKAAPGFVTGVHGAVGSAQEAKATETEQLWMPSITQSLQGQPPGHHLFKPASAQGILLPQNPPDDYNYF